MANYQSAYTGAQIDTAVEKINNIVPQIQSDISDLQDKTSILDFPTGSASSDVIHVGELIFQRQTITVPQGTTQTISFPSEYPHECFAVWVSNTHGLPSSPFSAANSIVCGVKSASQFYIYQNSTASGANMAVRVYSFGY